MRGFVALGLLTRLATTMKLNTFKNIGFSLLVIAATFLAFKLYENVEILTQLELDKSGVTPEFTETSLQIQNVFHHHSSSTQQIDSHSNSNISTTLSGESIANDVLLTNISEGFHLPHPRISSILHQPSWIQELKSILKSWKGLRQIIIVTSNSAYKEILLNWLISAVFVASVPLEHILVVTHDEPIWRLMEDRGISSIFVPPSSLFQSSGDISIFGQIMMTRISVIRLLNHWRFDVAMLDTDALLLKDPWLMFGQFPESDIVASMGRFPSELSSQWGTCLCVGVILIRNSNRTGTYIE